MTEVYEVSEYETEPDVFFQDFWKNNCNNTCKNIARINFKIDFWRANHGLYEKPILGIYYGYRHQLEWGSDPFMKIFLPI